MTALISTPPGFRPDTRLGTALEHLETPIWLACGSELISANAAARNLRMHAEGLPQVGRQRRVELAGRLHMLTAHDAPEYGPDVRMIEGRSLDRPTAEVADGVQSVFRRAPEGAAIVGRDGCIRWTNEAYDNVTGRRGAEDVGAFLHLVFPAGEQANAVLRKALIFGTPAEFVAETTSGPVSLRFLPLEDELGRAPSHLVLIHDEAAAQAAATLAARLTKNEVHLSALEDMVPGVLFQLERSPTGRHRFSQVGTRCESVLGVSAADLEDRVDRLFDVIHPEDLRELKHALELSREQLSPLSWTGRAADSGKKFSRWLQITARPTSLAGRQVRWHGLITDVSHQKEMQERVESRERLASVGELAAGVAHEINNPLAYVLVNITSALEEIPVLMATGFDAERTAMVLASLREAKSGGVRVQEIVRDLKQLSRPTEGNIAAVDIQTLVRSSVSMAMSHIRHRARLSVDVNIDELALGNEARLTQVILNLLVNAAQAIPEGHAKDNRIDVTAVCDGENIIVEVCDTGCGIAPDVQERIFEPFFTTKNESGGTGLGLSIVNNIVREHGGRLEIESEIGIGTTFRVVLAVAPRPTPVEIPHSKVAEETRAHARVAEPSSDAHILVVDDEPALVRALARQLRGFRVTTAQGGAAALEILRNTTFDVILCDLMMPDCTGMELYAHAIEIDPEAAERFVFMTGGVFTEGARRFLAEVDSPVLEKPFDVTAVKESVANTLERGRLSREGAEMVDVEQGAVASGDVASGDVASGDVAVELVHSR